MSESADRSGVSAGSFSVEELTLLLEVSRQLGAPIELGSLMRHIEQAAHKVLNCERATVFVYDAARDELRSQVATGVSELRIPAGRGIAGEAAHAGLLINVGDAYADPRFNPEVDRRTGFRTRNLLTVPLNGQDGGRVGVLQVLNKKGGPFGPHDEALALTLSTVAGVALHRQILLEERAEKQRLEHDLDIARQIQQKLLPTAQPRVEGFDVAGWNRPATETGGDCYDFQKLGDGRLVMMLADATGHGIGPALMIAEWRALVRALVGVSDDLAMITGRVNELLLEDLPEDRFVTAFFGLLDPARRRIDYISAGQGPILVYRAFGDTVESVGATMLPLGILPMHDLVPPAAIELSAGDMVLLATDGFYEWQDSSGEEFGTRRVSEVLRRHRQAPAEAIIAALHAAVTVFAGDTPQAEDLTAILVKSP